MDEQALRAQLESLEAQSAQLEAMLSNQATEALRALHRDLRATVASIRVRLESEEFKVGGTCLAPRLFDRRHAEAVIESIDASEGTCLVCWLHPRQRGELPCRFWKQEGGCKHAGQDCPFSHGVEVRIADLQPLRREDPGAWLACLGAGSRLLAKFHADRLWYPATAQGPVVDGRLPLRFQGYEDDLEHVAADEGHTAPLGDDEAGPGTGAQSEKSSHSDSEEEEDRDGWQHGPAGLLDRDGGEDDDECFAVRVLGEKSPEGKLGGLFEDAYVAGEWERHTKGFGSRMLAKMGYRRGEGLGRNKQGIAKPVTIRVLPAGRSLDSIRENPGASGGPGQGGARGQPGPGKKRPRAPASRGARGGDTHQAMFSLINGLRPEGPSRSLLDARQGSSAMKAQSTAAHSGGGGSGGSGKHVAKMSRAELRAHAVSAREAEAALAAKTARLEESLARNEGRDERVAAEVRRRLAEARAQAEGTRKSRAKVEQALRDRNEHRSVRKGSFF